MPTPTSGASHVYDRTTTACTFAKGSVTRFGLSTDRDLYYRTFAAADIDESEQPCSAVDLSPDNSRMIAACD